MPEKCPICGVEMDADRLHDHLVNEHGEAPQVRAAEVGAPLPAAWTSAKHKCVFCGATFDAPEGLKQHHLTAHGK